MEDDRFIAILRRHFPDADVPDHEWFFTNDFLDDDTDHGVISHEEQERALRDFQRALLLLDASYARLHRDVQKALNDQFRQNELERAKYAPGFSFCGKNANLRAGYLINHIRSLVLSATGTLSPRESMILEVLGDQMERQPSAIKVAGDKVASMRKLTGKAAKSETWKKIACVDRVIRCWDRYGTGEVKLHSQEFLSLLQDLIDALGRDWDAAAIVDAYRRQDKLA